MLNLSVFLIGVALLLARTSNADTACTPELTRSPCTRRNAVFFCDKITCDSVATVIYEKTDVVPSSTWTPVYESVNESYDHALDTGTYYTLVGRVIHATLHTRFIFEITHVSFQDNGRWRCVVIDEANIRHQSISVHLRVNSRSIVIDETRKYTVLQSNPRISEGGHSLLHVDGHVSLECEIGTYDNVAQIVFEKTCIYSTLKWTPVFKEINKTCFSPLDTGREYSLENRSEYTTFNKNHILYISPLTADDQGQWRCVVFDMSNRRAESQGLELHFVNICEPEISQESHSSLSAGEYATLQCNISTCDTVLNVIFEKTNLQSNAEWVNVTQGSSTHGLQAIDTMTYSLKNRTEYKVLKNQHILYIDPLIYADQGRWRCIVTDLVNSSHQSQDIVLNWAYICKPTILQGRHSHLLRYGHTSLECDTSTCDSMETVVYEKRGLSVSNLWTPVYEGTNKSHHSPVNYIKDMYSLENRSEYAVFSSIHILYISQLTSEDQGEWRCVVHHGNNSRAYSQAIKLDLEKCSPQLLEGNGSSHQNGGTIEMRCTLTSCIHVTKVIFEKADVHSTIWLPVYAGLNITHHGPTYDGYNLNRTGMQYSVTSASHTLVIEPLMLQDQGTWRCVVYEDDDNEYGSQLLDVNVYEPARILYPNDTNTVELSADAAFQLFCSGFGYYPNIIWMHNNQQLSEDGFNIKQNCNSKRCDSTVSSERLTTKMLCSDVSNYIGNYTCVVQLGSPYHMEPVATSPIFHVQGLQDETCLKEPVGMIVGISLLAVVIMVILVVAAYLGRKSRNSRRNSKKKDPRKHKLCEPALPEEIPLTSPLAPPIETNADEIIKENKTHRFDSQLMLTVWPMIAENAVAVGSAESAHIFMVNTDGKLLGTKFIDKEARVMSGINVYENVHWVVLCNDTSSFTCCLNIDVSRELTDADTRRILHDEEFQDISLFSMDKEHFGLLGRKKTNTAYSAAVKVYNRETQIPMYVILLDNIHIGINDRACVDMNGFFFTNHDNGMIYQFDIDGSKIAEINTPGNKLHHGTLDEHETSTIPDAPNAPGTNPYSVAIDGNNNLLVLCKDGLYKRKKSKESTFIWTKTTDTPPWDVCYDRTHVYTVYRDTLEKIIKRASRRITM